MFLKINIFLPFLFVSRGKTNAASGSVQSNRVRFQHLGIPDPLESCLIKHELAHSPKLHGSATITLLDCPQPAAAS